MSNNNAPPNAKITKLWIQLFGLVLWFGSSYAQFVSFNLEIATDTNYAKVVVGLGMLVSAVVIGLTIRAPAIFRLAKRERFWYIASAVALLLVILLLFLYQYLFFSWTCPMKNGPTLLIGAVQTPELIEFIRLGNSICSGFEQFPGNSEALFERNSFWFRFETLALIYIITWSMLSVLIVSLAQCFKVRRTIS